MAAVRRWPAVGLLALPAGLTIYFAFNGGGYFAGAPAAAALIVVVVLCARVLTAPRLLAGLSASGYAATALLALFAGWTLASGIWSHAAGRALVEYDRALMYLIAFALFASLPRSPRALRAMVRATTLALFAVCGAAFTTRALPHVWPISPGLSNNRLSFPLTYWNALGVMAAIGSILAFHLTCDERERGAVRIAAAATAPVFAAVLLLTFSRGGIAAAIVGLIAYVLLGRPRALLGGALAALPAAAVGFYAAYSAELLARPDPTTPAAVAQGRNVAVTVGLSALAAAALRAMLLRADRGVARASRRPEFGRLVRRASAVTTVVAVVAALALGAPGAVANSYDRFVHGNRVDPASLRARLTDPGNGGRLYFWRVAIRSFEDAPLHGTGAGTYANRWAKQRPWRDAAQDGHSLYLESAGELGIVGAGLITAFVVVLLAATARRVMRPQRPLGAAVFAVVLVWALHAGIDWDWEMPALTLPVLALAALTTARLRRPEPAREFAPRVRAIGAIVLLVLAVTPYTLLQSQAHLDAAAAAFAHGDCRTATAEALQSSQSVSSRAEPFELLAYCDTRSGMIASAIAAAHAAIARDPGSWRWRYDLALVRAAAGRDPRRATAEALALDPREPIVRSLAAAVRGNSSRKWRGAAAAAPLLSR